MKSKIQEFWKENYQDVKVDENGNLLSKGKVIGKYDFSDNTAKLGNLRQLISNDPTRQKWIKEDFEKSLEILGNPIDHQHDAPNQ